MSSNSKNSKKLNIDFKMLAIIGIPILVILGIVGSFQTPENNTQETASFSTYNTINSTFQNTQSNNSIENVETENIIENVIETTVNSDSKENKTSQDTSSSTTSKNETTNNSSNLSSQNSTVEIKKEPTKTTNDSSQTVWVGNTGDKYHRQSCRTLKGKGHSITLSQALAEGRSACQVCNP